MTPVKTIEARAHFSDLLNRVLRGKKFTITRYGAPVAWLTPIEEKSPKLKHEEIVEGMRALRKRVKPGKVSLRKMVAEGRRT